MPTAAQSAALYVGIEPPVNVNPVTRWVSQAARHVQVPQTAASRKPIIGNAAGNASATQEISPWFNAALNRYECLVNVSSAQYFSCSPTALGPWSAPVKVLGQGSGGEASNSQQCSVLVEGTTLWAYYITNQSSTTVQLARAEMPTAAGGTPAFTKLGTIWTSALGIAESSWIIQTLGYYWLFTFSNARMLIARSTGASPSDFLSTAPFAQVSSQPRDMYVNLGVRFGSRFGRPQVFREDGRWVMFGHLLDGLSFQTCAVYRFVSEDAGVPTNWVLDSDKPYLDQRHPAEVDQIADFRLLRGPNDTCFAFWTAANNPGVAFTVMAAHVREPTLASDGCDWYYTNCIDNPGERRGCFESDAANGDQAMGYYWDMAAQTQGSTLRATLPVASPGARVKLRNSPTSTTTTNQASIAPANATDIILGGNPVTAMSAVTSTVTMTTKRPHNLAVGDIITTTGNTPTGYNNTAVVVASVPTANTLTFTAGSSPAANTVLGAYVAALLPGESAEFTCDVNGIWVRG